MAMASKCLPLLCSIVVRTLLLMHFPLSHPFLYVQGENESILEYRSHFDGLMLELNRCRVVIPPLLMICSSFVLFTVATNVLSSSSVLVLKTSKLPSSIPLWLMRCSMTGLSKSARKANQPLALGLLQRLPQTLTLIPIVKAKSGGIPSNGMPSTVKRELKPIGLRPSRAPASVPSVTRTNFLLTSLLSALFLRN